tara:strand:- start:1004 stop:1354 length:351 start_codon:yes stop_codon:yes gene_type:complete
MRKTGTTNPELENLIKELKILSHRNDSKLWKRVASELEKPTRRRRKVNILDIEKNANDGDIILVPGKVLATGELTKKVKVAAWQFSESATQKIKDSLSISQIIKDNPKGKNIKLIC